MALAVAVDMMEVGITEDGLQVETHGHQVIPVIVGLEVEVIPAEVDLRGIGNLYFN
jgi:hypothetical protein